MSAPVDVKAPLINYVISLAYREITVSYYNYGGVKLSHNFIKGHSYIVTHAIDDYRLLFKIREVKYSADE